MFNKIIRKNKNEYCYNLINNYYGYICGGQIDFLKDKLQLMQNFNINTDKLESEIKRCEEKLKNHNNIRYMFYDKGNNESIVSRKKNRIINIMNEKHSVVRRISTEDFYEIDNKTDVSMILLYVYEDLDVISKMTNMVNKNVDKINKLIKESNFDVYIYIMDKDNVYIVFKCGIDKISLRSKIRPYTYGNMYEENGGK